MLVREGAVTPAWAGKAVVCIATGPSLSQAQLDAVRVARAADAVRVIAINDAYLVAPFADVLYYADEKWRKWQEAGIDRTFPWRRFTAAEVHAAFAGFHGQRCSIGPNGGPRHADTEYLRSLRSEGLSVDPAGLATGSNSGHQAVNIAALSGSKLVLLLGYDAKRDGTKRHVFGDHPDKSEAPYDTMRRAMNGAANALKDLGVRVVNCTPGSAIDCFERGELDQTIGGLLHAQGAAVVSA